MKVGFIPDYVSKIDLHEEIERIIKPKTLGMDIDHMPDRTFLVNTLKTIKPNH